MKNKLGIIVLVSVFIFQSFNLPIHAISTNVEKDLEEFIELIIQANGENDIVPLYEGKPESSRILHLLKNGQRIKVLEKNEKYSFVEYIDENDYENTLKGFILNQSLINIDDIQENQIITVVAKEKFDSIPLYEGNSESSIILKLLEPDSVVKVLEKMDEFSLVEYVDQNDLDETLHLQGYVLNEFLDFKELVKEDIIDREQNLENNKETEKESPTSAIDKQKREDKQEDLNKSSEAEKDSDNNLHFHEKQSLSDHSVAIQANQETLFGIVLDKATVYSKTSTSSKVLRVYEQGSRLKYKTLNSNWYEATVKYNGKWTTGYIHKNEVENIKESQTTLNGIALKGPTKVYDKASTSAKTIRSYSQGSILKYRTLTSNWYEATVKYNGKWTTGYIHKNDVENAVDDQKSYQGIALNSRTVVFANASTSSKKLKSYSQGSILKYRSFSNNWYQATVYINGKPTIGYIHKSHVDNLLSNQKRLEGRALKKPTNVYKSPSKNSRILKSYNYGSPMKFKSFSKNWYEATVYLNGKPETGYIHVKDITTKDITYVTRYDYTFKDMVDRQMNQSPKSDGAGLKSASRGEVEFFVNPLNFPKGSNEYYQFLILSEPLGLNAKEVNDKILKGKGHLEGQAQAFINAGREYGINEAYLIAHALHETGNGNSTLASGVPVDKDGNVTRDSNGKIAKTSKTAHTVYNMFGYGAYDACPVDCGAKYAFDKGWFTVTSSIIGGIGSIYNYINRGQDTLYKMRWNPDPNIEDYLQYATHVQWATAQTKRIAEIYNIMGIDQLYIDIPVYNSMIDYKNNVYGITQATSLNFRSGPGTNYDTIGSIPNRSKIQIINSNPNGWYNINFNGKTGWVSASYVNLIY